MADIPKSECHRLTNINYIMNEVYESIGSIYEDLVDRDYNQLKIDVSKAIKTLKSINESIEDEP